MPMITMDIFGVKIQNTLMDGGHVLISSPIPYM
jgi:hypothetical protein